MRLIVIALCFATAAILFMMAQGYTLEKAALWVGGSAAALGCVFFGFQMPHANEQEQDKELVKAKVPKLPKQQTVAAAPHQPVNLVPLQHNQVIEVDGIKYLVIAPNH